MGHQRVATRALERTSAPMRFL